LAKFLASLCEPRILIYDALAQFDQFPDECRYIPKNDSQEEFNSVCRKLRSTGNITFFVEECERYIGQGRPLGDDAFDLISRGRNWGIGLVAITRRIQRLNKDFFDLAQNCFFFRCGLKSREYIADMIGWQETRKIMSLPPYHFLYYNVNTETSSVHVLKLAGQRAEIVTKESEERRHKEEASIKQAKVEQVKDVPIIVDEHGKKLSSKPGMSKAATYKAKEISVPTKEVKKARPIQQGNLFTEPEPVVVAIKPTEPPKPPPPPVAVVDKPRPVIRPPIKECPVCHGKVTMCPDSRFRCNNEACGWWQGIFEYREEKS
jgi:hypothetical protein